MTMMHVIHIQCSYIFYNKHR